MSFSANWLKAVVVALLVLICQSAVRAAEPPKTPEQLIDDLSSAAKGGDVDGFLANVVSGARSRMVEAIKVQVSLRAAQEAFFRATDEKFGKGPSFLISRPNDFASALKLIDSLELLDKRVAPDGTLQLRVKTSFRTTDYTNSRIDTFTASMEDGGWKLWLPVGEHDHSGIETNALNRITAAVLKGEFKDRSSAVSALNQALAREIAQARSQESLSSLGERSSSADSNAVISVSPQKSTSSRE
jgi:hypothetical protein